MKKSVIIKNLVRKINNSQVNLTKCFENFGGNLLKFAQIFQKKTPS